MRRRRSGRRANPAVVPVAGMALVVGALALLLAWGFGWLGPLLPGDAAAGQANPIARGGDTRLLASFTAAEPKCCAFQGVTTERGAEGCTWHVASWKDAPVTRVPWGCPPTTRATRSDPDIYLVASYLERGPEGCSWYAASWSDGLVTRAPATCPPGAKPVLRAMPLEECYRPRQQTAASLRPAGPGSIFQNCTVITYYGYPDGSALGILGTDTPERIGLKLLEQALPFKEGPSGRGIAPAFHVIEAVAQRYPQDDGSYLNRIPLSKLQPFLDAAEKYDFLVIIDVQIGWSTVEAEVKRLLPLLRNPRVHLALDPEFAMRRGVIPGDEIGSLSAADINLVQQLLQELVEADGLPNKILIIHQFQEGMIKNKPQIADFPAVDVVIDMDGFGAAAVKQAKYEIFVRDDKAEFGGIKLFYKQDTGLMTPQQLLRLRPQPDVVIYQ